MKMLSGLMVAAGVIVACSAIPSVSYAQSTEDCLCLVPDRRDGQPIGTVLEAIGQVQVSQAAGFDPASAGTSLNRGDRIIVGPQSNALISVLPDCRRVIPANTDVVLDPVEPNICVRLSDATRGATTAQKNRPSCCWRPFDCGMDRNTDIRPGLSLNGKIRNRCFPVFWSSSDRHHSRSQHHKEERILSGNPCVHRCKDRADTG